MSQPESSVWRQMLSVRREERAPLALAALGVFLLMAFSFLVS